MAVETSGTDTAHSGHEGTGPAPPRPRLVVMIGAAVVLGTAAVALVTYLLVGGSTAPAPQQAGTAAEETRETRVLAHTSSYGQDTVRIDLGAGAEAAPTDPPPTADTAAFVTGDGVEVRVRTVSLYNEGWDETENLDALAAQVEEDLAGCRRVTAAGSGGDTLPTGMATSGSYVRAAYECAPAAAERGRVNDVYGFVTRPRRVNADNVERTWVLVHASGDDASAVARALADAVGTLDVAVTGSATPVPDTAGPVPPDPSRARNDVPTEIWTDTDPFLLPAGWGVVGAGAYVFVAPPEAGIDDVRGYRSPGIVLTRADPKPGGGAQDPATLRDGLVDAYSQIAAEHGCAGRSDFERADGAAEILWTDCPTGLVDRVVVSPDGGGAVLVSVRVSDPDLAADLVDELAG